MRRLSFFSAAAALALLAAASFSSQAFAQASCPISAMSPVAVTANRTLNANDNCGMFVVTSNATITLPATATAPAGWQVWIKAQGATATITPSTGTLDGVNTSISATTGLGVGVRSDATNYFSTGLGVSH